MDSTNAVKARDSRFTQSVDGVSPAAVQYGHDQAMQLPSTRSRRNKVPKNTPVITLPADSSVWKKAKEVAGTVAAATFTLNPDVRSLATVADDATKRRQYVQGLIVRVDEQTIIVCNSPAHALEVRKNLRVN